MCCGLYICCCASTHTLLVWSEEVQCQRSGRRRNSWHFLALLGTKVVSMELCNAVRQTKACRASLIQDLFFVPALLCFHQCSVNVTSAEEVLLSFAPLLLALDDGSRCLLAECRGEVVASALGGIHADVFLHMNQEEQKVILDTLVGRELRCLVGRNGAGMDNDDQPGPGGGRGNIPRRSRNYDGGVGAGQNDGSGWNSCSRVSDVHYRVERIASANPAADLAHALECAI